MQLLNKLTSNPKRLFLLDGLGACLTTLLLVGILVPFQTTFGMPQSTLQTLYLVAIAFGIYSILCFLLVKRNWILFLKIIATANTLYCCLTAFYVVYYFEQLTVLGVIYFVVEMAIIVELVYLEMKTISKISEK